MNGSNGRFSGEARAYLGLDELARIAKAIEGFPVSKDDQRALEVGTFDPRFAGGGVRIQLSCRDSWGHVRVYLSLRSDGHLNEGLPESVEMIVSTEAASIDSFVKDLRQMQGYIGESAFLALVE